MHVKSIIGGISILSLLGLLTLSIGGFGFVASGVSTFSAGTVTWSENALVYNSTVLPCMMENAKALGMPATVVPRAICVTVRGAEGIAAGTDNVVDVTDLRAATAAFIYNFQLMNAQNLADACMAVWKLEVGNGTGLLGQPLTNCLENTGIDELNCTELTAWIDEHADAINSAMATACTQCGAPWDPNRPVPEFTFYTMLIFIFVATVILLINKRYVLWEASHAA